MAFSLPTSLAGIFTILTLRVDRILVGRFLQASEVGVYQAATQAAMLSAVVLGAFNAIFSPMIARLYHGGQSKRLRELYKISTKWGLYVSLPLFLVIVVAPQEVMSSVFGEAYAEESLVNDHAVTLGSRQAGDGPYDANVAGVVDEVAIWPRALTTDEVRTLHEKGRRSKSFE